MSTQDPIATISSYDEINRFLSRFTDFEKAAPSPEFIRADMRLPRFRELLRSLGDPHLKYAVIHVAGTKGKGSTCAYLASALQSAGFRTGLYTSPHLRRYNERIRIDGVEISDADLGELLTGLAAQAPPEEDAGFRTVFEHLTAAAFLYFERNQIDIAIIETGLGGRVDCTNVFDETGAGPLVSVITPIGIDHVKILGSKLETIAYEKAGIIQPHSMTVLAVQPAIHAETVKRVVEARLAELGIDMYVDAGEIIECNEIAETAPTGDTCTEAISAEYLLNPEMGGAESLLGLSLFHGLQIMTRMFGAHQLENIRTAVSALLTLENSPDYLAWAEAAEARHNQPGKWLKGIAGESVRAGILRTRWPGRFEVASSHPLEILDGAHCALSATALAETYRDMYGTREVILVVGFLKDKDAAAFLTILRDIINVVALIAITPDSRRAVPAEELAEIALEIFPDLPIEAVPDVKDAIASVIELRDVEQAVIVTGSFYILEPARTVLREHSTRISQS